VILCELSHLPIATKIDSRISHVANQVPASSERSSADTVLPMPSLSRSVRVRSYTARLASLSAQRHPIVGVSGLELIEVGELVADHLHRHFARYFPRPRARPCRPRL